MLTKLLLDNLTSVMDVHHILACKTETSMLCTLCADSESDIANDHRHNT